MTYERRSDEERRQNNDQPGIQETEVSDERRKENRRKENERRIQQIEVENDKRAV